ncbi:hypothetical protein GW17_00011003 [Ensete ventricosum]|nr:hypothetical protein GW17_00011003 [Ensete ventricosum]RZR98227.1 hypothetical protein BHM03_00027548 [Ensete ventricosum]
MRKLKYGFGFISLWAKRRHVSDVDILSLESPVGFLSARSKWAPSDPFSPVGTLVEARSSCHGRGQRSDSDAGGFDGESPRPTDPPLPVSSQFFFSWIRSDWRGKIEVNLVNFGRTSWRSWIFFGSVGVDLKLLGRTDIILDDAEKKCHFACSDGSLCDLQLPSIGINPQFITFTHVTMESDKYICVRETSPQNSVVIVDMNMPMQPLRRPITADSALMNPNSRILALKGVYITSPSELPLCYTVFLVVVFWKWITPKMLGLVTQTSVYHWSIEGETEPIKMFDRAANLTNNQIINYKCDPTEKWLVLIGIAPGAPEV